jgi:hypothetical protein
MASLLLSDSLIRAAQDVLQGICMENSSMPNDIIPIKGTPFSVAEMSVVRGCPDFLLCGIVEHPVTGEPFGIGLLPEVNSSA